MTTTFQAVALLFTAVIAATTFGPAGHAHSPDAGTTMANRTWTVEEMGAEVERYGFRGLRGGGEPPVGGSVVVALSEFFGVGKLWSDLDQPDGQGAPAAIARRDEIAEYLLSLPRVQDSVLADRIRLIETEWFGDWECDTGVGCYPKGHVVGIVDIPRDRADELCGMFHRNEWFCAVAGNQ